MASWVPIVPIDDDGVPVGLLPVAPEPLILEPVPGLSDGPAAPVPIPLELLPDCCANTRGAATKTTARANMMVLLSLLVMDVLLMPPTHIIFISRPLHLGCTALCRASSRHRASQEILL